MTARNSSDAPDRPGWVIAERDPVKAHMARRRWRILDAAKPPTGPVGPHPARIETPEDFARWLATKLSTSELCTYFQDIEAIAKMACDLELLRFSRKYLHGDIARELAGD